MRAITWSVRATFALLASVPLVALAPEAAHGQAAGPPLGQTTGLRAPPAAGFAAIAGVVDDSIRGGPLAGATVALIGTSLRTRTDRGGFFRIDSIPPGEAQLAVLHPMLDTLSLSITSARFPVVAGRLEEVGLATPPLMLFRDRLCPRGTSTTRNGMLVGRVDEADKDAPVANAVVSLVYIDPASGSPVQRVRTVRSRDDGFYIICGLPETINGTVQAAVGSVSSSEVTVVTKEQYLATTSFLLSTAPRTDSLARGNAVLSGRVTNVAGTPLKEAQVAVEGGTAVAITGDDGSFTLAGLPSGTTNAVIRKIGFSPALRTVNLRVAVPARISVALSDGARTLATVTVTGKMDAALKKVGWSDRRAFGARSGFLSPEDIAKQNPRQMTDLFRMMPGFKVTTAGMGAIVQATRSSGSELNAGCVNVFVDRVAFQQLTPGDLDGAFPVSNLGAIESYASASETPAEFRMAGKSCATIVAWTKMKLSAP